MLLCNYSSNGLNLKNELKKIDIKLLHKIDEYI